MDVDLNLRDTTAEGYAGGCACGGHFKIDASPRCPRCRSADLLLDITIDGVHYEEFYD